MEIEHLGKYPTDKSTYKGTQSNQFKENQEPKDTLSILRIVR